MASAKQRVGITPAVIDSLVDQAEDTSGCTLTQDEKELIRQFADSLLTALEKLQRAGRNGIWAFVLRNSYRPGLLGKFNGLVSNPPWLALSKIAENPYTDVKKEAGDYSIKPPGPSHLHIEMATIFLLHAVDRYLIGRCSWLRTAGEHHQRPSPQPVQGCVLREG